LGHLTWNFKTATISHSITPPGFKFYFKTTPSSNLANLLPVSLPDFDPTRMIYELAGQGITDNQRTCLDALLYNKPSSERLKKAGVLPDE
jgi:hypothetical protein